MAPQLASGSSGAGAEYPHDPLWDALREVEDPELGVSLVDMGLIVSARREEDRALVALTYTAMGCPATEMIDDDVRARLLRVPGIRAVQIDVVWEPAWTTARLTDLGRDQLLLAGVSV
jgi:metal-sulfur cluster biosynthetic enzyme